MTGVRLTHVGGPTVLIETGGWRLLTDPTFDPPGRKYSFGWGTGSRKTAGPAIPAAEVGPLDAVLLTHDHHDDNLDPAGRALLPSAGTVVTTVPGARRLGGGARGLAPWETTRLEGEGRKPIEITATPCRHGPPLSRPLTGEVVGFALAWASGTVRCGSRATRCSTTACARWPSACGWTLRCSTSAACGSRSPARCATR